MAEIILFKGSLRSNAACGSKPQETAQIIIFPGVRIDRGKFSLADRLKPSSLIHTNAKRTVPKQRK